MIRTWGLDLLRSGTGVIDVGGEPGFVAIALLERGIPATIVDPSWRMTGKTNRLTNIEQMVQMPGCPKFQAFQEMFDEHFYQLHQDFVDGASAIISLYGDEATEPSLRFAASLGKPCALIPCNECMRFFPSHNRTYDGYVQACMDVANQNKGRFELVNLVGAPFSRALLVQPPLPHWAKRYAEGEEWVGDVQQTGMHEESVAVPLKVLKDLGVLYQVLWKMELAKQGAWRTELAACLAIGEGWGHVKAWPFSAFQVWSLCKAGREWVQQVSAATTMQGTKMIKNGVQCKH